MDRNEFHIVGIGASAGGHNALRSFFKNIPTGLPAAFVVVTHLYRSNRSELHSIVSRFTSMKVYRIQHLMPVQPGTVYVMPENVTMQLRHGLFYLKERPADEIMNKAIDIFFESLADEQKQKAIGIVLSGMGTDGAKGVVKIFEHGGYVLVQDPTSTAFNSMPIAAILKDHPEYVLPPEKLGERITQMLAVKKIQVGRKTDYNNTPL